LKDFMHIFDTERLRLRTLTLDDAPFYVQVLNTPQFIRWLGDRKIRTELQARDALAIGPLTMQSMRGFSLYLVERQADGAALGICGLIKREALADVDIGYAFLPQYMGQGDATEAAAGTLQHARKLGIKRVVAITTPGNDASDAVLRRIGMRFEQLVYLTPEDTGTQQFAIALD
jgi:RimJ/RimL family protein N-acetyltransferase